MTTPQDMHQDDHKPEGSRAERIELLLRRAVERGGYMTNADLLEARELLRGRPTA